MRMGALKTSQAGFSMIELMVALAVMAITVAFIGMTFESAHRSYVAQEDVSRVQQDVRTSLNSAAMEISMAGFGIPANVNAIAAVDPAAPSITLNVITGSAFTYITSNLFVGANKISVNNASRFAVNDKVRILDISTRNLVYSTTALSPYVVNAVDSVSNPNTLTLSMTPAVLSTGDLVVVEPALAGTSVTYSLAGGVLSRSDGNGAAPLIANVPAGGLTMNYQMDDGSLTANPGANLANVTAVQLQFQGQTTKAVAKDLNGNNMGRQMNTWSLIRY